MEVTGFLLDRTGPPGSRTPEVFMPRRLAAALTLLALCSGVALAEEIKGTLLKLDLEGKTVTVKVGDDEKKIKINDKTEIGRVKDDKFTAVPSDKLPDLARLVDVAAKGRGILVEVTTEGEGDKKVGTKIVLKGSGKGKEKDKGKDKK